MSGFVRYNGERVLAYLTGEIGPGLVDRRVSPKGRSRFLITRFVVNREGNGEGGAGIHLAGYLDIAAVVSYETVADR